MSVLRALGRERRANNGGPFGDSSIPPPGAFGPMGAAGVAVTEQTALNILAVGSCVKVLSDDMSVLPLDAYAKSAGGRRELDRTPRIVAEPFGPNLSPQVGFQQLFSSYHLRGNAFAYVVDRDPAGFPTQLLPLHPDWITPEQDQRTGAVTWLVNNVPVPFADIIHVPNFTLAGRILGLDPIEYAKLALGGALAQLTYADKFFKNNATPGGFISLDVELPPDKVERIRDKWQAQHSGVTNAHKIGVLTGGAKFNPVSVTPEQAQFLDTRRFGREEICGLFGVPLQRIQAIVQHASQGGGKGLEQQDQGYVTHSLVPPLRKFEWAWTRMIPGGRTYAKFNVDALLRADLATRYASYMIARTGGWLNNDEIRTFEDLPPIPGGDGADYAAPLNSAHAGDTGVIGGDGPPEGQAP